MIRLIFYSLIIFLVSCSDQKNQLPQGKGVPNPSINTEAKETGVSPSEADDRDFIPGNIADRDPTTGFEPREGLDNERDNLTEINSKKPIIFDGINPNNSGLAGINFKTTLGEAEDILSDPIEFDCGFYYEEGMCIQWQKDGVQKPIQIIIIKNYLGEINLPAPIGKIRMGADLTKYFSTTDPVGRDVLEEIYRAYFKVSDPNYSCIQDGKCEAREVEEAIIWRLPNMFLQISKENGKQLFLIVLENKFDSGILASDFDIVKGSFSNSNATVKLGDAWGDVKKIGEVQDAESVVQTTNFKKDYDGVSAWVYRPDAFGIDPSVSSAPINSNALLTQSFVAPVEAKDQDIFGMVSLYGSYPGKFLINGQYIKVNQQGDVFLSSDKSENKAEFLLKTQLSQLADEYDLQVKILKNLENLLTSTLKAELGSNLKLSVRYDGFESRPAANKWINFTINYVSNSTNPKPDAGFIFVGMSVHNGYVQILKELTLDPFATQIAASFDKEIVLPAQLPAASTSKTFGSAIFGRSFEGFKIGEEVLLTEVDWLRKEALFVKDKKSVRVSFEPRSYIRVSYVDNETEVLNVWSITNVARVSLGLTPLDPSPYGKSEVKFRVSAITSHLNPIGINGLCGFKTLVKRDQTYAEIRDQIVNDIKINKQSCAFFGRGNVAEDSEYDQMFFPDQKVKLIFKDNLFTGVTVYE